MQTGVINLSTGVDDREVAFWVDAWDRQAEEVADVWKIPYVPVSFYTDTTNLPVASGKVRLLTIQDKLDVGGAGGYHTDWLGLIYSRILWFDGAVSGSHETVEMTVDPTCDRWAKMPDGRELAYEASDPVENDVYDQDAKVGPDHKPVKVSNYVFPSYFDPNGSPPFDRMGRIKAPFTMTEGGYQVVRGVDGSVSDVFAQARVLGNLVVAACKLVRPESRLLKRLRG